MLFKQFSINLEDDTTLVTIKYKNKNLTRPPFFPFLPPEKETGTY